MNTTRVSRFAGAVLVAGMVTASLTGCSLMELVAGGGKGGETTSTAEATTAEGTSSAKPSETTKPSETSSAPEDKGTETSIWDIKPGDCFSYESTGSAIDKVTLFKSCDSKHQYEAFHAANMTGDKTYPGDYSVQDFAEKECGKKFDSWVNDSGDFSYNYIGPSQESWEQNDDREVLCVAEPRFSSETTGSAAK